MMSPKRKRHFCEMLPHVPQALKSLHTRQLEMNAEKLILPLFLHNIEEATEQ